MRRSSRVLLIGLVLLLLGIGNLWMGGSKMREYQAAAQRAIATDGPSVAKPFRGTATILEPATDARFLYESANIKHDYYRVVHRGGSVLAVVGGVLVLGALIRRILVPVR